MLHCQFARVLWNLALSCLGISWVAPDSIGNHLLAWEGFFGRKAKKKEEAMVLLDIICWCIWRERNRRVFESTETPLQRLKENFIKILYFWKNGKLSSFSIDLTDCVDSLY